MVEQLKCWEQEHGMVAVHIVADQEAESEAESKGWEESSEAHTLLPPADPASYRSHKIALPR